MCLPAILLYRTARVAVRQPDGTLITTEGKDQQVLYITQHGILGGTGQVATYLMQPEMTNVRAEIIYRSMHPVCNYVWKLKTDYWQLQVRFTSPWQPFAQLAWFLSPEGYRCIATAYFARAASEVVVRMGPSGRAVGKATQTPSAGHGSPITCSIDIDNITEHDQIVIFLPDDPTVAPVLSQAFRSSATELVAQVAQPIPSYTNEGFSLSSRLPYETIIAGLGPSSNGDITSTVNNRVNTADAVQLGGYMSVCVPLPSNDISLFHSQPDQLCCDSRQYHPPYTDSASSASNSSFGVHSDDGINAQFVDDIDDRCIVVKPLP
ncbi:hypothetical protein BDP55DRAFT_685629 [Colletotrichum godetiae]|uniref:Uncharacterized protein n=1 Tax=Colletotrichum godetiae TaxID=1209918 RepID=A0AAJ0A6Q4_9PEZI|nr:uncharacterized protein BDP55DRAFT_685629 [Colletotrichum godetiae]KAK1657522.1 hypothetical protein BDP55DRAFT_685629 [Colletotrichum godetiae]